MPYTNATRALLALLAVFIGSRHLLAIDKVGLFSFRSDIHDYFFFRVRVENETSDGKMICD